MLQCFVIRPTKKPKMKFCIFAGLIALALAHLDHHSDHHSGHHHHDDNGQPNSAGNTVCSQLQDASVCSNECSVDQVGYCYQGTCHCKSKYIVRQAGQLTCTTLADCSKMDCGHEHGGAIGHHNHGGYCHGGHCHCPHITECGRNADCAKVCNGNGTSTCHHFILHGHCTHCH